MADILDDLEATNSGSDSAVDAGPGHAIVAVGAGFEHAAVAVAAPPLLSAPAQRTALEHHMLCAKMREAKLRKQASGASHQQAENVRQFIERLAPLIPRTNIKVVLKDSPGGIFGLDLSLRGKDIDDVLEELKIPRTGTAMMFSYPAILRIIFDKPMPRSALACTHACSPRTVRRLLCAGGAAVWAYGLAVMRTWMRVFDIRPPSFACCCWMWDETAERVRFAPSNGVTSLPADASTWDVLVSRMRFSWGWLGEDSSNTAFFEIPLPPVALIGNAAKHIYNAVVHHEMLKEAMDFKKALFSKASEKIEMRSSDGHLANHKVHAHLLTEEPMSCHVLCGNHSNNLTIVGVVGAFGKSMISDYYRCVLFLRMGGHYLRLSAALAQHLKDDSMLRCVTEPAAVVAGLRESEALRSVLKDYALANYEHIVSSSSAAFQQIRRGHRGLKQLESDLDTFFKVFNGPLWHRDGAAVHLCAGPHCCASKEALRRKAMTSVQNIIFRCQPKVPVISKWTQLGPCVDWFLFAAIFGLVKHLFPKAFGELKFESQTLPPGGEALGEHEEQISWHAVAGTRYKSSLRFLNSADSEFDTAVLAVVLDLREQIMPTATAPHSVLRHHPVGVA